MALVRDDQTTSAAKPASQRPQRAFPKSMLSTPARARSQPRAARIRIRARVIAGRMGQWREPKPEKGISVLRFVGERRSQRANRRRAIFKLALLRQTDPRDLFIRLELRSHELRGATFRVRECWWPTCNGGRTRKVDLGDGDQDTPASIRRLKRKPKGARRVTIAPK